MDAAAIKQLSDGFNNGQRFIVVSGDKVELVSSREEANARVSANAPAIAFSVRDLIGGVYDTGTPAPDATYRRVGTPYGSETGSA